jgi:hypothetical protein
VESAGGRLAPRSEFVAANSKTKRAKPRARARTHTHINNAINPKPLPARLSAQQSIYDTAGQGVCGLLCVFSFSIAMHELLLWAALGRSWRTPWLAVMSFLQLPLMPLLRRVGAQSTRAGNLFFWLGLSGGMAMNAVLYARDARLAGQ